MNSFISLALAFFLAACGATEPYVYKPDEFNRNRSTFNLAPVDLAEVGVCYNSVTTTPDRVQALAEEQCQAFGKRAHIADDILASCPLLTPAGAMFRCVK